jgi:hypothetical protein
MVGLPRHDLHDSELDDPAATPKARWHGCAVEVTARLVPRYLWTTASIDVFLGGRCILRTGGQMKIWGSHSAEFHHDGEPHTAELSWDIERHRRFPYVLLIDGAKIAVSEVPVRNVAMLVIPVLILPTLLVLLLSRL